MDNKFYTDDFERLLKERSDEFRMYPSKRVWHSIYNDLHPGRRWPSIAMSLLLIIALLYMGYLNNDSPASKQLATTANTNTNVAGTGNKQSNTTNPVSTKNNNIPIDIAAQTIDVPVTDQQTATVGLLSNSNNNTPTTILTAGNIVNPSSSSTATTNNEYFSTNTNNVADDNNTGNNNSNIRRRTTTINNTRTTVNVTNATAQNTENTKDIVAVNKNLSTSTSPEEEINGNENIAANTNTADKKNNVVVTDINITGTEGQEKNSPDAQGAVAEKLNTQRDIEKAWIENYAFYNKSNRKRWKDRMAIEFYTTPNMGYRTLSGKAQYDPSSSFVATPGTGADVSKDVRQSPGLGLEAGIGLVYSIAKKVRVKSGLQLNLTNYNIHADNISHPVITTLLLNDPISGMPIVRPTTSTLSNNGSNLQPIIVHNKTYQVSIPVGVAYKLYGKNKLEWFAGASVQPSYVFGGQSFLISSDRKNYIQDPSFIRKFNINTGVETYVSYNVGTFNLQAGPQFRYQLFSTYNKQYTNTEKLYNVGLKIGLLKNF